MNKIVENFQIDGKIVEVSPYGNGHINTTYLVVAENEAGTKRYILQRINSHIFKQPKELMNNVLLVTEHLKAKITAAGGDPDRETLCVILSKDGAPCYEDAEGNFYRMYKFVEDTICYEAVRTPEDFYESAVSFGHFQSLLADFNAESLVEVIPSFHDTKVRFARFREVLAEDKMGRAALVQDEINFVLEREALAGELVGLLKEGKLPLRVTHNDTKLNNILMDAESGKGICVIDLDTVMPGLAVNDFGDSIRFGASTALEDEKDLSKVSCSMELFDIYAKGFIEGCGGSLTAEELKALPLGAKTMTFECGMRFLTDYLEGDVYFKTHREGHNLDRCRTQFTLVKDMEAKWDEMNAIVEKYMK